MPAIFDPQSSAFSRVLEANRAADYALEVLERSGLHHRGIVVTGITDPLLIRSRLQALGASIMPEVEAAMGLIRSLQLPSALEQFRTHEDFLNERLSRLGQLDSQYSPATLSALRVTSAVSDALLGSPRVDREIWEAARALSSVNWPAFETLAEHRALLDAAGLTLPHWPRPRLISMAEKRRKFRAALKANAEPPHVRRAQSLVHRYELTLREILDSAMAETYGEDWPETRLPLCDCGDLLGRWRKLGGNALEHADYAHYRRIMSHPDHFSAVFEAGFDNPIGLATLLDSAGRLRARSHHARNFTPEDLRDLRLTWRMIETGLLAFTPDYEVDY